MNETRNRLLNSLIQNGQIHSIQALRGLACLAVYFLHFFADKKVLPPNNFIVEASKYGFLGVQAFFIISGFIIPYSMYRNKYELKNFLPLFKRRIIRIELPYIASIFLLVILSYGTYVFFGNHQEGFQINWKNVLLNIGYLNVFAGTEFINFAYWTLFVELQFYICIGLIYPLIISQNGLIRYCIFLPILSLNYFWGVGALLLHTHFPLFMIGIFTFQYAIGIIKSREYFLATIITIIGNAVWMSEIIKIENALPVALVSVFALFFIFTFKNKNKVLEFLGKVSFSLYLIHVPVTNFLLPILGRFIHRPIYVLIYRFGILGLAIICSYLFYLMIEKPALKLSKKFKI
jgi:peptidoglycan/LPS O-acetylase OafA/YrhL